MFGFDDSSESWWWSDLVLCMEAIDEGVEVQNGVLEMDREESK